MTLILYYLRENPGKRFHMEMNECGQEALLINLMQKHNIRMSLNLLRRTLLSVLNFDVEKWITSPANAIITVVKSNNTTSMDLKYNYNKKNQICIRFIESQMSIRNYFAEIKYVNKSLNGFIVMFLLISEICFSLFRLHLHNIRPKKCMSILLKILMQFEFTKYTMML